MLVLPYLPNMVKSYNFFTGTSLLAMFNTFNVATLAIFYTGSSAYFYILLHPINLPLGCKNFEWGLSFLKPQSKLTVTFGYNFWKCLILKSNLYSYYMAYIILLEYIGDSDAFSYVSYRRSSCTNLTEFRNKAIAR